MPRRRLPLPSSAVVGRRVCKAFPDPEAGSVWRDYFGTVTEFSAPYYKVVYEEDGDEEEYGWEELLEILVEQTKTTTPSKRSSSTRRFAAAVVTPDVSLHSNSNDRSPKKRNREDDEEGTFGRRRKSPRRRLAHHDDDGEDTFRTDSSHQALDNTEQDEVIGATNNHHNDDESYADDNQSPLDGSADDDLTKTASKPNTPRVKKARSSTKNSNNSKGKKSQPAKRFKNSSRKQPPNRAKSSSSGTINATTFPVNSIAARGAPQGALCGGRGGLKIRIVQDGGIRPLLSQVRLQKAAAMLRKGLFHEAAKCIGTDVHEAAAFVQHAKGEATTTTLSPMAAVRLHEGLQAIETPLSGRIRVVHAGWDETTGQPVCPLNCVGQEFESAAELHRQVGGDLSAITYAMCVEADDIFGPWSLVVQRLETAGLIAVTEDDDDDDDDHRGKEPLLVAITWAGGESLPQAIWQKFDRDYKETLGPLSWALMEGATRNHPPIVVGISANLLSPPAEISMTEANTVNQMAKQSDAILPPLSAETSSIKLPSSLLEKSIRRSFCSTQPLLEACAALLHGVPLSCVSRCRGPEGNGKEMNTLGSTSTTAIAGAVKAPPPNSAAAMKAPFQGMEATAKTPSQRTTRSTRVPPSSITAVDTVQAASLLPNTAASLQDGTASPKAAGNNNPSPSTVADKTTNPPIGGTLAMLSTTWKCMLNDASPFAAPPDRSMLGLEELFMLSLIAKADLTWRLPPELLPKAVVTALRVQRQPANFGAIANTFRSEYKGAMDVLGDRSSSSLRKAFVVMTQSEGSNLVERTHLDPTQPVTDEEISLVKAFLKGFTVPGKAVLDTECRLAAYDSDVSPTSLLLVQAILPQPPRSWKKHSLPSLAKHVNKLVTHANARMPEFRRLTRLSAWGNAKVAPVVESSLQWRTKTPGSAREVVTSTGLLSDQEHQVVDCFEAVQRWRLQHEENLTAFPPLRSPSAATCESGAGMNFLRMEVGPPPTKHDGRIAFLLAFALAEEIEVRPQGGQPEVVNVLFCGDRDEPLLVQRIGEARKRHDSENADTNTLGYVKRGRSEDDRHLIEAAEQEVSKRWRNGRQVALPLPHSGFQWKLPTATEGEEEAAEQNVEIQASLNADGSWKFCIAGVVVDAFDARNVIRPCSLDVKHHDAFPLDSQHVDWLSTAFYAKSETTTPESLLNSLARLHIIAVEARARGANEGSVYDWVPLALKSQVTPTMWRDAILAIKTREKSDVVLGPIQSDGTCKRDMTEGCLLRIFYALESLYPSALVKTGALSWFVRQRGAGYHHMMTCLEDLSRGETGSVDLQEAGMNTADPITSKPNAPRSKRKAAKACYETMKSSNPENSGTDNSEEGIEFSLVPRIRTKLWPHQAASVDKVVAGVKDGKRGHADASAVGAGKTLTALATVVHLSNYMLQTGRKRNGSLVILPTNALVKEWLLQIAAHTSGFHVIEQRETGQLFSLTYAKSDPPIDSSAIVISTLDRVCAHPFMRQAAWDFVVIDECLALQNADAKRCPAAWRQIEVSALGVLMLSATFFRSKFNNLFYMIRMFRSPLPRSMEWLPATIHEHIVCQVPETDRTWKMECKAVPLSSKDLKHYRGIIGAYKRKQMNSGKNPDYRRLFSDLSSFLRLAYEGRDADGSFGRESKMADACYDACQKLLQQNRRPLVFADTTDEADHFRSALQRKGIAARTWSEVSTERIAGVSSSIDSGVIVAVKSIEGQGINMQSYADSIVCRPTPSDHLEQMKGRVDRPGQLTKELVLVVLVCQHTVEEAKFANIHLAGNFFREYIAPVASRYKEQIDLEATLAASGTEKLKPNTVMNIWRQSLEKAGQSGSFAKVDGVFFNDDNSVDSTAEGRTSQTAARAPMPSTLSRTKSSTESSKDHSMFSPRNRVLRNKGDPVAVRQAKANARSGHASAAVRQWLFNSKKQRRNGGLPKDSLERYSDASPPVILDSKTIRKAVAQLSLDPKLAALIQRVGAETLIANIGEPTKPTQASLFDQCVRAITFTMVSVLAGNSFMRKLSIKVGVCIEMLKPPARKRALEQALAEMQEASNDFGTWTPQKLHICLLDGNFGDILFTPSLLRPLLDACYAPNGKPGFPHLWGGPPVKCGKDDDPAVYRERAREFAQGKTDVPVSVSYSQPKAGFIVSLLKDFDQGKISGQKLAEASDREAVRMLLQLKGIGDWSAMGVLLFEMKRANIMNYGDLTLRNYLNDLYDINHNESSYTSVESLTDFPDTAENRDLIDALATINGWEPYRSVILHLMYHLQEENLVLV